MNYDAKMIGFRMKQRRKECHLTQEELAEKLNISKNYLSSLERGIYTVKTPLLFELCNVLGYTPDYYLIGSVTDKTKELESMISSLPQNHQEVLSKIIATYAAEVSNLL